MAECHSELLIQALQSDRGDAYLSVDTEEHIRSHGTVRQYTNAKFPHQNRATGQMNRTLLDLAR